jgi:hypothetical protein
MRIAFWSIAMAIGVGGASLSGTVMPNNPEGALALTEGHLLLSRQGGHATAATGSFLIVNAASTGGTDITIIRRSQLMETFHSRLGANLDPLQKVHPYQSSRRKSRSMMSPRTSQKKRPTRAEFDRNIGGQPKREQRAAESRKEGLRLRILSGPKRSRHADLCRPRGTAISG